MLIYVATTFFVCLIGCTWAQYYGSQPPTYSQQNQQQQNSEAWRRWYYQQRQQEQQAGYNSARARQSSSVTSPAANSQYSRYQRQPQQASGSSPQYAQPQYQQYYQQQYQQRQPSTGYNQQQGYAQSQPSYGGYQQPQANYRPQPPVTPPPTTPAVPVEVEFEMEVPTTTTPRPRPQYSQWGQYSQNYGNQYQQQPLPSSTYQQGQYQPQGQQNNYYQQPSQPQQHVTQPDPAIQQQYGQNSWGQTPNQSSFGSQFPPQDPTDPFSSKVDATGLKPTVFNTQYQPGSNQGGGGEFAGLFGEQNPQRQNPGAPPGKVDFGAKGPNPIQLNQFLAQPTPAKDSNALDALLGTLLSGTVAVQNSQKASSKPVQTTTRSPPAPPASSLISDRLNDFVLGPKSEFRSNKFNEIPVNNAAYDNLNPLAGFMGETPPPPVTTTPIPPGRNGDFLEGFIGVNRVHNTPRPTKDNFQPNIYIYNQMNDAPPPTSPPPPPPPSINDQSLNNMGTQDLSAMVQKLLGALAEKQGGGRGQG